MNVSMDSLRGLPPVGDRAAVLIPALVALVLRVIYVLTFRDSPAFEYPIMDEAIHDGWARGGMEFMHEGVPYFRAPLYIWFLQLNYAINDGYFYVRIVQAILSAVTVAFVADLGRRLAGPVAGLVGGLLLAFCWPVIYFAGELVIVSFFMVLVVAGLWCLVRAQNSSSVRFALAGAALLGLASIARPTALVFLPALVWLGLRSWQGWLTTPRVRISTVVAMIALMLLPGLALTVRNQIVGGDAVFISSQGGLNFYIGNNPESDGRTAVVPGTSATWAGGYVQATRLAEEAEGRSLSASEVSDHYYRRGLEYWASDPADALRLYARKLRLLLGAAEQSNNKNPHFWRDLNPLLRLPIFSSWALIFSLGIVGLFLVRRRPESTPLNLFVGLYAIGLMLFFINERFRVPETIVLASFAGVPIAVAIERWRENRTQVAAIGLAAIAVLTLSELDRVGFNGDRVEADAFSQYTLANMYMGAGDSDRAAETYLGALDAARRFRLAGFDEVERMARDSLVEALFRSRREEEATQQVEYFRGAWPEDYRAELLEGRRRAYLYLHRQSRRYFEAALARNPAVAEAFVGIARAQIATEEFDGAEKSLRRALAVGGPRADAWGTFALLELSGRGSEQRANRYSRRALELDPGEPSAHRVLGDLYLRRDDLMGMTYHYRLALLRDPHNTPINRFLTRARFTPEDLISEENLPPPPPLK